MCVKLLRDNLIVRVMPHPRTSITKRFDPHAHCLYHIDTVGHKIKNYWSLKHDIEDLTDTWMIIIGLPNIKYEVSDQFKVHHISPHNPPRYSLDNSFVIEKLVLCEKGLQDEYPHKFEKPKPNKPKFKVVLIIRYRPWITKWEREKEKERSKLQRRKEWKRKMKKMKAEIKGKFLIDDPQFFRKWSLYIILALIEDCSTLSSRLPVKNYKTFSPLLLNHHQYS